MTIKEESIDLDSVILKEIENQFKTARRLYEDLNSMGMEINDIRLDKRLKSLRKYNLVEFKFLDFPIPGPKPMAYKKKAMVD